MKLMVRWSILVFIVPLGSACDMLKFCHFFYKRREEFNGDLGGWERL